MQNSFTPIRNLVTLFAAFACLALAPAAGRAAVAQWIGGSTGTWGTASGWSGGVVPNNSQSATYLVTVAQQVGFYSNVTINSTTPSVTIDQLTLRPTASVNIANGATLYLRDLGQASSLQRSLVGGGTLQIATGGTLQVALNGGVISGDSNIQMNGGRIAGTGRIENARSLSGSGTVGRSSANVNDAALVLYNVGSVSNPSATRILADRNGQSLTLNLGNGVPSGDFSLLNRNATLGAINGGKLVIRINGGMLYNDNGIVDAGTGSEIELAGTAVGMGTITGAGTLRVTGNSDMTYTQVNVAKTVIEGSLGLNSGASLNGQTDLSGTLSGEAPYIKATGSVRMLPTAATPTPRIETTSTLGITNGGAITGGGTITSSKLVNTGSITATLPGTPLLLDITGTGINLGAAGQLVGNGGVLTVGKFGATAPVSGSGAANLVANQGGVIDVYNPLNLPAAAVVNNGGITLYAQSTLASITGTGITTVWRSLDLKQLRSRMLIQAPTTFLANGGVSRSTQLSIGSSGSLDLTNNPLVLDYAAGGANPFTSTLNSIKSADLFTTFDGRVIGIALANAIGSPASWNNESIDDTTVLVLPTFKGDANLDLAVNFNDLVRLAQHYNQPGTWSDGDFDYDGTVDFDDLVGLAQHYSGSTVIDGLGDSPFAADWVLAQSLVPEPGMMTLLLALLPTQRRRR